MDIRVLQYFEAIVRHKSLTKAAAELHVAQPALSVAIKKLEEELGAELLIRVRNQPVCATQEGELLLRRAKRIFTEVEQAKIEIADQQNLRQGSIKIAVPQMYGFASFPDLIESFHRKYPGIFVSVIQQSAGHSKAQLENGDLNLAILDSRRISRKWHSLRLESQEMVLCCSDTHPLTQKESIEDSEIENWPLALMDGSFMQRQIIEKRCELSGFTANIVIESNYIPTLIHVAKRNIGLTTLLSVTAQETAGLHALSFTPKEYCHFAFCWTDPKVLSRAERAFIEFVEEYTTPPMESG